MSADIFNVTAPPWVVLVVTDPSQFTNWLWRLKREIPSGVVVQVRGAKMKTTMSLFDEMAAAFQFPYYFGENWNALDECLADLEWLPGSSYVLGVLGARQVLALDGQELRTFGEILTRTCEGWAVPVDVGQSWDRSAVPFHVVLQCERGEEEQTMVRFNSAGIDVALMALNHAPEMSK